MLWPNPKAMLGNPSEHSRMPNALAVIRLANGMTNKFASRETVEIPPKKYSEIGQMPSWAPIEVEIPGPATHAAFPTSQGGRYGCNTQTAAKESWKPGISSCSGSHNKISSAAMERFSQKVCPPATCQITLAHTYHHRGIALQRPKPYHRTVSPNQKAARCSFVFFCQACFF